MEEEKCYTVECEGKTLEAKAAIIPDKFTGIVHSDFLDKPAVNTINWVQPDEFIRCPHCGELAKLRPEILTSMPPKRHWVCEHCGHDGYIFCHEAHIIYGNEKPDWNPWEQAPETKGFYGTKCIICGEEHSISMFHEGPFVCDKCKKAVMKMRKLLEEE